MHALADKCSWDLGVTFVIQCARAHRVCVGFTYRLLAWFQNAQPPHARAYTMPIYLCSCVCVSSHRPHIGQNRDRVRSANANANILQRPPYLLQLQTDQNTNARCNIATPVSNSRIFLRYGIPVFCCESSHFVAAHNIPSVLGEFAFGCASATCIQMLHMLYGSEHN